MLPKQVSLHVGNEMDLLDRACHATEPTELLVAPVDLHQRNINRRLREADLPKEAFEVTDAASVSRRLLDECAVSTRVLDHIDRLGLVEQLVDESAVDSPSIDIPAGVQSSDPEYIEQVRTDVEMVSNYHPERLTAWRETADSLQTPIDADTRELLEVALDVEAELRTQTDKAVSDIELIRRATRQLAATSGDVWTAACSHIDRLSIVGLSSISAPYADLVNVVAMTTSVDIHIHCRPATSEYLTARVPPLFDIDSPGEVVFA
jgi:ATP-dependent helicase/nuclease subunit B